MHSKRFQDTQSITSSAPYSSFSTRSDNSIPNIETEPEYVKDKGKQIEESENNYDHTKAAEKYRSKYTSNEIIEEWDLSPSPILAQRGHSNPNRWNSTPTYLEPAKFDVDNKSAGKLKDFPSTSRQLLPPKSATVGRKLQSLQFQFNSDGKMNKQQTVAVGKNGNLKIKHKEMN